MTGTEHAAALVVAAHARDADDCRTLLSALGLLAPVKPKRGRVAIPADAFGHGDTRRYNRGCRCRECTTAVVADKRAYRARLRADPAAADRSGHGLEKTYRVYGCRCAPCTAANTDAGRVRRARRRARERAAP